MASAASVTFSNKKVEPGFARETVEIEVKLAASGNYLRGTLMGELTATPGTFAPYASGASDGTQNPKGILVYDCTTDASGNVTFTSTAGVNVGQQGQTHLAAPIYLGGWFLTQDLLQSGTGAIDATAITKPGFILKQGTIAQGVLHLV